MSAASAKAVSVNGNSFCRPDGQKRRVLYAEDQASARTVTTALLERMGFHVEAVEDGELAFEKAKTSAFDVILLDIEMPVMDGVTAARHIRAEAELCKGAPILALSAFLADSTEHSAWRDAFDSALPKPANSNELHRAMSKALAKTQKVDDSSGSGLSWSTFAANLPAGTLNLLIKAAGRELNHLMVAYASCREAGDVDTAAHCLKNIKSIATSFEISGLFHLLAAHESSKSWPGAVELLKEVRRWKSS